MIENDWLPAYGDQGFSAAALYAGESPAFGQILGRYYDVDGLSIAWDLEWEVFDKYRIPGTVFPLRVLVDRDGTVIAKFTGEEPDEVDEPCEGRGALCETRDAIEGAL